MQDRNISILMACNTASHAGQYASYLEGRGYRVRCVYAGADAVSALRNAPADMVIADMALPGGDGLWLLDQLTEMQFNGRILLMCGDPADPRLMTVGKRAEILHKPLSLAKLGQAAEGPGQTTPAKIQTETLPENLAGDLRQGVSAPPQPRDSEFGGFIGTSMIMQALYEQIYSGARSTASVFITGESGTGKEVCAQAIHRHSPRAGQPFVPLNCAAIPRDLLESEIFGHVRGAFTGAFADRDGAATMADDGTLFLDEIGDMDPAMQTKLLRFLQDGTFQRVGGNRLERVDVRIICATNRNPVAEVRAGRFREDLFYRLHVLPITMPPLRARGQDIIDIAQTLLLAYAAEEGKRFRGLSPDAEKVMMQYEWPGNIRQLQNIIRHAVVMGDGPALTAAMLPAYLQKENLSGDTGRSLGDLDGSARRTAPEVSNDEKIMPLHVLERRAIEKAITLCHGNIPRAAALLQVSPSTLYRKKAGWDEAGTAPLKDSKAAGIPESGGF
ncbi:MAG: Regulatory protein LuxO [Micavibrio sp.]|nr:Regulatory protein LuxO [Micavibrio sp.]